jgi:3-methyladenine DNA glycosylase AlkD
MLTVAEIMAELEARRDDQALAGMARYGIRVDHAYGVSLPELRALGKRIVRELGRRDPARHRFALDLWKTGIHEGRLLAGLVDLPDMVTERQTEAWVLDLDSWDVCDQLCNNLFVYTSWAWPKAVEWSERQEEFVKRAGFVLMASLAVHDKAAPDERFLPLLAAIERQGGDERNFVKKAVNWALRSIGKRNPALHARAVETAGRLAATDDRAARWVAAGALRELEGEAVRRRLGLP